MKLYLIENTVNNKKYIGQTTSSVSTRWVKHLSAARRGANTVIARAIRKYGKQNFTIRELMPAAEFSRFSLDLFERFFIRILGTTNDRYGYNKTNGGKQYWNHLPEVREKISQAQAGKIGYWAGKKQSLESRILRSAKLRGKVVSEESRKRMRDAALRRGISPENRLKMVSGQKKWLAVPENRRTNALRLGIIL